MTFATFLRMNMFLNMITIENVSSILINHKNLVIIVVCCLIVLVYNKNNTAKEDNEDEHEFMRHRIYPGVQQLNLNTEK